jgi:molybdopterin-synthase adenylyltransferase
MNNFDENSMLEYFNRQVQLWGKDKQLSLINKKVLIIGCGGLGCSNAIALGSCGIGEFTFVDFDRVSIHNIHRQIGFKIEDEGKYKCEVLQDLIQNRSPYVKVTSYKEDFQTFVKRDINNFDLIIDGSDNLPTRAFINEYSKSKNIPWIYGSVEEFYGQVCFFHKASYQDLFKIKTRKPNGIACPIVMHIASLQSNIALRYLACLNIKKDYLYYLCFDDDGVLDTKKFKLSY